MNEQEPFKLVWKTKDINGNDVEIPIPLFLAVPHPATGEFPDGYYNLYVDAREVIRVERS